MPRFESAFRFRIWNAIKREYDHVSFHSFEDLIDWTASQRLTDAANGELDIKAKHLGLRRIEQWTGLRDDKGVYIYEGDIVAGTDSNGWECPPDHYRVVVEWDNDQLKWIVRDPWSRETFDLGDYGPLDLVIGNVIEHPHLIAQDDEEDSLVGESVPFTHLPTSGKTLMSVLCDFPSFWNAHAKWSEATFGTAAERGPMGPLKHLAKEVGEVQADPTDLMEYADCFLLICDSARRAGFTSDQLLNACWRKLEINKTRKWAPAGANDAVEHIEGEGETQQEGNAS